MGIKTRYSRPLEPGEVIRHAERDEFDRVLELLRHAFPHVPPRYFETLVLEDPEYDPRYSLVIELDGVFRSHVQIFPRSMMIDGRAVRFGGIGNVGTHPAYRRRGYATRLLRYAIDLMKEEKFEGSLLFTDIPRFYAKLGWSSIPRPVVEMVVFSRNFRPSPDLSLAPMRPEHLEIVRELADSFHTTVTGRVVRDEGFWFRPRPWVEEQAWVVLRSSSMVGFYFCVPGKERTLRVSEYAYKSGRNGLSPADFFAVLQEIGLRANASHLVGNFLFDRELRSFLEESTLAFQERMDCTMMWLDLGRRKHLKLLEQAVRDGSLLFWDTDAF